MSLASQITLLAQRIGQEFKSARTPSAGVISWTNAAYAARSGFLTKLVKSYDGVVTLVLSTAKNAAVNYQDVVCTLPVGFRPSTSIVFEATGYGDTTGGFGVGSVACSIDTNGIMTVVRQPTNCTSFFASISF